MYRLAALALLATSVAAKGGCPSTDLTIEDWMSNAGGTHGACMTDDQCQNDGECCVNYHVGYCGVPSDCNEFLQCRGAGTGVGVMNAPATNEEFQALLARVDGGGAYYDGCPPRSETWDGYLAKGGPCTTNLGCATDNPGSCCVRYTFPYCGVPSACNEYLQCLSPGEEAAAVTAAIDQGPSPVDQSETFAAALGQLYIMGAGSDTDPVMDPSSVIEKLGACVTEDTMEINMQCIQSVLSTLDPAVMGKLAQCAGGGSIKWSLESIAEMQACVEEQLSGGGEVTEPPAMGNESMPDDTTTMPPDTTSPGAFTGSSGFTGFSVVALVVGLFL